MRKTYRNHGVEEYWQSRWDAVSVDTAMQNITKYPLNCSLKALEGSEASNVKILEAGCGTGRLLRYFHDRGYDITGIDFIEGAIKKIVALDAGYRAEVGDITNLRFKPSTFTHVLAFGLYHNFEEAMMKRALDETYRVMAENGVLCASFRADNVQNYINDKFFKGVVGSVRVASSTGPKKFHKINLKAPEVRAIMEASGFRILSLIEMENMPLLYKIRLFRHHTHRDFDEVLARSDGYRLNKLGASVNYILKALFKKQFCSLYIVWAVK